MCQNGFKTCKTGKERNFNSVFINYFDSVHPFFRQIIVRFGFLIKILSPFDFIYQQVGDFILFESGTGHLQSKLYIVRIQFVKVITETSVLVELNALSDFEGVYLCIFADCITFRHARNYF